MITRQQVQECADRGMHKAAAARVLGVDRKTFDRAVYRYDIKFRAYAKDSIGPEGKSAHLFTKRWMAGFTIEEIAEEFNVTVNTVKNTQKRLDLPKRNTWGIKKGHRGCPKHAEPGPEPKPLPEPPASILRPDFSAKQAIELMQCKGHTEVAAFAEKHSMTLRLAQQRFHQVRAAI